MARTWESYSAVICCFLIWFSVIQAMETEQRFGKMFLRGSSSRPYLKRWGRSSLSKCAVECSRWSGCKSFSIRPSLQECSLYAGQIIPFDIIPAPVSEEKTFYWRRLDRCSLEKGYTIIPGTNKCLRFNAGTKNWTEAEATCEAEGGHLAFLEDLATWGAVRAFLEGVGVTDNAIYMGGVKSSTGQWMWLDGRAVEGTLWYPGEPNNQYGYDSFIGLWWGARASSFSLLADDIPTWNNPFLCEI